MHRIYLNAAAVIATLAISAHVGTAQSKTLFPLEAQGVYLEIGGGDVIRSPLNGGNTPDVLASANLSLSGGLSCDMWDGLHLSLDAFEGMVEDHLDDAVNELQTQIVTSIVGAAQGLVTAALQRAMPGMYDWSMNVNSQIETNIGEAKLSCDSVLSKVNGGLNPDKGWINSSVTYDWELRTNGGVDDVENGVGRPPEHVDGNILRASQNVANNKGETDIPWFTGMRGGASQEPILVVNDSAIAGYAVQSGSAVTDDAATGAAQDVDYLSPGNGAVTTETETQELAELWGTPQQAADWITDVVGEKTVSFCEECTPSSQAGRGLDAKAHEERNAAITAWQALLDQGDLRARTIGDMQSVSSNKVHIPSSVLEALELMPDQDKMMFINRMASDVAAARTVEKALAARSLLKSALSTPEVQGIEDARTEIEAQIGFLRNEIEDMLFDIEAGNKLASKTPGLLVNYHKAKIAAAAAKPRIRAPILNDTMMQIDSAE